MNGPSPDNKHPMDGFPQVCFIKNTITNPNIIVGEYTYYDDPEDSENFERNVLYHFPFIGDKLIIGKFCALAKGRALHHERRKSQALRNIDLSISDLRQWVGESYAWARRSAIQG